MQAARRCFWQGPEALSRPSAETLRIAQFWASAIVAGTETKAAPKVPPSRLRKPEHEATGEFGFDIYHKSGLGSFSAPQDLVRRLTDRR